MGVFVKINHSSNNVITDDKLNIGKVMISLFDREVNTVGKGESAGYPQFLHFPQCLLNPSS